MRQAQYFGGVVLQVFPPEHLERVSQRSVSQESPKRAPRSVFKDCLKRVSQKSFPRKFFKNILKKFPARLFQKSTKSVLKKPLAIFCTRVLLKSFEECLAKVSYGVSCKSVLKQCFQRVPYESLPQEPPTRASYKSVP